MNNQPRHKLKIATCIEFAVEWPSYLGLALIAVYRAVLSPVLFSMWGPACRFEPTCSAYAAEAIGRYGLTHGMWIALKRFIKCRPLGGWGFDPLPAAICASGVNKAGIEARYDKRNIVG